MSPADLVDPISGIRGVSKPFTVVPRGQFGALVPTAYVGGTTAGAPTGGTFKVGNWVVDTAGKIWVCTASGTPGTWVSVSSTAVQSVSAGTGISVTGTATVPVVNFVGVPYKARATATTQADIVNTGSVILKFNTIDYDPNGNFDTSTFKYTAPVSGYYLITGGWVVNQAGTQSGRWYITVFINGTTTGVDYHMPDTNTNGIDVRFTDVYHVNSGQTVDLRAKTDRTTTQSSFGGQFAIHYLST